jgi:phospholipase/carboxylesterase
VGATAAGLACRLGNTDFPAFDPTRARLSSRPGTPSQTTTPGQYRLWNDSPTCTLIVPDSYVSTTPLPLVVSLHGAGITADGPLAFLGPYAQAAGFLLLVPDSLSFTWDAIRGDYGPDIVTIDAGLQLTFDRCAVDPTRICLEGFSDGASYALGVGILNSAVFTRLVAFSPGFVTTTQIQPTKPRIFISHGRQDTVLPIDQASRLIVPTLENEGFVVDYHEFDGDHTVPPDIAATAVDFMMAT